MEPATVIALSLMIVCLCVLVHGYGLYPFLAFLIRPTPSPSRHHQPAVSVLVPAHNEEEDIRAKIENFQQLDYPPELLELIIVNDGSTDATSEIAREQESSRVRVVDLPRRQGKPAALKRLFQEARHPVLLLTDANVLLHSTSLSHLVAHLQDKRVGAVTGKVELVDSDRDFSFGEITYYFLERRIQSAESRLSSVMGVDGGMYVVRRELLPDLPPDTLLDDMAVSLHLIRHGHRVIYDAQAQATERGTESTKLEFARRVRIAAGAVQLLRRGPLPRLSQPLIWFQFASHKLVRWFSPILLMILVLTTSWLAIRYTEFRYAIVAQLAIILLTTILWWFPWLRKIPPSAVLVYFGLSQVAIAVGLVRGLLGTQTVKWKKQGTR